MESLIYLHPDDIGAHPVLKYFEENGAFSYTDNDLTRLIASFKTIGPLQPILITPAGANEDGWKWWRIAGKLRMAAAKKAGCNLPCYIRTFDSDDEIIRAARYENSIRRHWDVERLLSEDQLIDKLIGQRSRHRLNNTKQLHPEWHKFLKSGLIKYRSDDAFISRLKDIDYDIQETLAEAYSEILSIKVSKGEDSDSRNSESEKIAENVKKEFEQEISNYNKKTRELIATIDRLQEELTEIKQSHGEAASIDEIAERYESRIVALRAEKHTKEAEIMQLKNELCSVHQKFSRENDLSRGERYNYLANDLSALADSTLARLEQLARTASTIFNTNNANGDIVVSKDAILVLNDQLEKFVEKLTKQASDIRNLLINQLKRYKDNQSE